MKIIMDFDYYNRIYYIQRLYIRVCIEYLTLYNIYVRKNNAYTGYIR